MQRTLWKLCVMQKRSMLRCNLAKRKEAFRQTRAGWLFCRSLDAFWNPPTAIVLLLIPTSIVLLIFSHTVDLASRQTRYISYAISIYNTVEICRKIPGWIAYWKRVRTENPYVQLILSDTALRIKLSLGFSVTIHTAYALFMLCMGMYHRSLWYYAFAVYYGLLVLMRLFLLREVRGRGSEGGSFSPGSNLMREWNRYRLCGWILLAMNLALGVIVVFIVYEKRVISHNPITTIVLGIYTVCALIYSVYSLLKFRKYKSPVYTATKVVRIAAALVSVMTFQSALTFALFGKVLNSEAFRRKITAMTGGIVIGIIVTMAVSMILISTYALHRLNNRSRSSAKNAKSHKDNT